VVAVSWQEMAMALEVDNPVGRPGRGVEGEG